MIFAIIGLSILTFIFSIYMVTNKGKDYFIPLVVISVAVFIPSFVGSLFKEVDKVIYNPKYVNVVEGRDSIFVETDIRDFKLTEIKDRSILKAKKFYITVPKNPYGFELSQRTKLVWE